MVQRSAQPSEGSAVAVPAVVIEGDRVRLRCWEPLDAEALRPACGRPEICGFTTVPATYTPEAAQGWIARQEQLRRDGVSLVLAIELPGGPIVGTIWLFGLSDDSTPPRLGCWLLPAARGRGLCGDALDLLARWVGQTLDVRAIRMEVERPNVASRRVVLRAGARHIETVVRARRNGVGSIDLDRFELTIRTG